ncbi:MAG: hypothetical protein ACRCWQ_13380, partial [Bacilli bacterium]
MFPSFRKLHVQLMVFFSVLLILFFALFTSVNSYYTKSQLEEDMKRDTARSLSTAVDSVAEKIQLIDYSIQQVK